MMNKISFDELCKKGIGTCFRLSAKKTHIKNHLVSGDYIILHQDEDHEGFLPIKLNSTQCEFKICEKDVFFFDIYELECQNK